MLFLYINQFFILAIKIIDAFFYIVSLILFKTFSIYLITRQFKKKQPIIFEHFLWGNSKVQVRINPRLESLYVPMLINGLFPVISLNCIKHIIVNPTINVKMYLKRYETFFIL